MTGKPRQPALCSSALPSGDRGQRRLRWSDKLKWRRVLAAAAAALIACWVGAVAHALLQRRVSLLQTEPGGPNFSQPSLWNLPQPKTTGRRAAFASGHGVVAPSFRAVIELEGSAIARVSGVPVRRGMLQHPAGWIEHPVFGPLLQRTAGPVPPRIIPVVPAWGLAIEWPIWFVVLLVPFAEIGHRLRDRTRCAKCGYALTGLPSSSPCPECGTLV